jgi:hypothetical protein
MSDRVKTASGDFFENVMGLMMSLNMLIEFGDAFDYTGVDFTKWCLESGFQRTEIVKLEGPSSAAIAYERSNRQKQSAAA